MTPALKHEEEMSHARSIIKDETGISPHLTLRYFLRNCITQQLILPPIPHNVLDHFLGCLKHSTQVLPQPSNIRLNSYPLPRKRITKFQQFLHRSLRQATHKITNLFRLLLKG